MKLHPSPLTSYVALLRGINVGGNNIIKMSALQSTFQEMGFLDVRTYIQSGNVIFRTAKENERKLEQVIEKTLSQKYNYQAKVAIRNVDEMKLIVKNIPQQWFEEKDQKYNVIFLRKAIDSKKILESLHPKAAIEEVIYKPGVLYWSAKVSDLAKTSLVKLSSQKIYQEMTVRNLNTTQKLLELMQEADVLQ